MSNENYIKQLLIKFSQDNCSLEEKEVLLQYFRTNPDIQLMPEVKKVLRSEDIGEYVKAERLYAQIRSKIRQVPIKFLDKRDHGKMFYFTAIAAVFLGFLGLAVFFEIIEPHNQPEQELMAASDAIILDLGNGQKEVLSETGNVQIKDRKGNLVGGQTGNKLIYKREKNASKEIVYNTLNVPYGQHFEIQLSDGSIVHLNAGSSLKYPVQFPKRGDRRVYLSGEAFFKVAKDPQQQFIVTAGDLEIGVLGTEFNVSAYKEDKAKSVVLVQGSVRMESIQDKEKRAILKPGQLGALEQGSAHINIQEVDTDIYTSWLNGELIFKNLTFESILKKMERHYDVNIVNNNTTLANEKFNARFKNDDIVEILHYFRIVYGLSFEVDDQHNIVINP
jgi:hypothetical protein